MVWWHRGRCLAYGEGVAFWALAEIVRQRLGIAEEDPAEVAAGKLAEGLDQFVPDPAERAYAGARLGRLLGVALPGMAGGRWPGRSCSPGGGCSSSGSPRSVRWRCWSRMPSTPIAGLLDFLDHLVDWARDLPIYVWHSPGPELGQTRPGFGTGRNRVTLTLDPLDAASMDALVEALVPGMPHAARAAVTARRRASRCSRWKPCEP